MATATGIAIDYARVSGALTRLQSSLDAGALAAAKDPDNLTDVVLRSTIEKFIVAHDKGEFAKPPTVKIEAAGPSKVSATAEGCVKIAFSRILNASDQCVSAKVDVERPVRTYLELALVLDNSGSMTGTKITAAKNAATQFVNSMFANISDPQQVKISVVPFTLTVNAGSGMNVNSDSSLDRAGRSSIHWQNLVPDGVTPPVGVTSRFALYQQLGETWSGCFEMRPGNYGLNDSAPSASIPDSLFVPMFAPDEPGMRASYDLNDALLSSASGGNRWATPNSYVNDDGSEYLMYDSRGKESSAINAACTPLSAAYSLPFASPTASWQSRNWSARMNGNLCRYNLKGTTGNLINRKSIAHTFGKNGAARGPNYGCNAIPLQRMTNSKSSALAKIGQMNADGNTNILEGFMWGWRTISPNAPYADGRAYNWDGGQIRNKKIIVLMTDGDNFWTGAKNPEMSIYSPFGYFRNNRLGTGITSEWAATLAMNAKTKQACENARALRNVQGEEAIQIYTIGFSVVGAPISGAGLQLLKDCASTEGGRKLFYQASDTGQLAQVFSTIAGNIGRLKVTR